MSIRPTLSVSLLVLGAVLVVGAPAARAQECAFLPSYYEKPPIVAVADAGPVRDALDRGELAEVARLTRERLDPKSVDRDLQRGQWAPVAFGEAEVRAALAIAVVRTGGAEGPRATTREPGKRNENLAWARRVLSYALDAAPGDPVLATWLGEAEAAVGARDKALALLEDLAEADLIVSPEAWAILAALRDGVDDAGAAAARKRCAAVARDPATCAAPLADARS